MYEWFANILSGMFDYLSYPFTRQIYLYRYQKKIRSDAFVSFQNLSKEEIFNQFIEHPHSIVQYDPKYRYDKYFIMDATIENPLCLSYALIDISDKKFIIEQCKKIPSYWRHYSYSETDIDFWKQLMEISPSFYTDMPDEIKKNKAFKEIEMIEIPPEYQMYL